jgi:hypothetical protein
LDGGLPDEAEYAISMVDITPNVTLYVQEIPKIYIGKSGI